MSEAAQTIHEYWLALGEFVHTFALVESVVQSTLWAVSDTPSPIAKAIFSGTKTEVAASFIRRIFEAQAAQMPDILRRPLEQLQLINALRNDLLHFGIYVDSRSPEQMLVSNQLIALPGKVRVSPISPTVLGDLTTDLKTIMNCLALFQESARGYGADARVVSYLEQSSQTPWRYTPRQQAPAGKTSQSRGDGPNRPRQRKPSEE